MDYYNHDSHTNTNPLSVAQKALARSRAYKLFGQFFIGGLTHECYPYFTAFPELTAVTPPLHEFDKDEAAATHYTLFSLDIFPYESIFRHPKGLLGSDYSVQTKALYSQAGFVNEEEADHIGQQLQFLAFLARAEAESLTNGETAVAQQCQKQQRQFLATHLLTWLPALTITLQNSGNELYKQVCQLTLALIADQYAESSPSAPITFQLPTPPDLLNDDKAGLKDFAEQFTTPPFSGLVITRKTISDLGRTLRLPRGFGSRTQMLSNLLQTAVQYDNFPSLINQLIDLCYDWQNNYTNLSEEFPHLSAHIQPWKEQTDNTIQILTTVKSKATLLS